MAKLKIAFVILILATFPLIPSTAYAQSNVCGFYGTVTLDGDLLKDGTTVKAWIDNVEAVSTTTYTNTDVDPPIPSYYSLTIDGIDNGFEGKQIFFTVEDEELDRNCPCQVSEAPIYESGANTALNLSAVTPAGDPHPRISLSPETGFATNVCGWDFAWNSPIFIYFDDNLHTITMIDDKGRFCIPLIPPTTAPGEHTITVVDSLGNSNWATLTIRSPANVEQCQRCEPGQPGKPGEPGAPGEKGEDAGTTISFIGLIVAIIAAILVMVIGLGPLVKNRHNREIASLRSQ